MTNFEKMVEKGREIFLTYDQDKIIEDWNLDADDSNIYFRYLGKDYAMDRNTGKVPKLGSGGTLAIYDLFCCGNGKKPLSGNYCSMSALVAKMAVTGPAGEMHDDKAEQLLKNVPALTKHMEMLGAIPFDRGDVGFVIPVFKDIAVRMMLYYADEDFSASMQFMWDEEILSFMHYETLYYVIGDILPSTDAFMVE